MYEQFSIDSKLLKPNLSFLKSIEENNSKINSFSIKGSMIENPVGDIDIVDKRNLKSNKNNNNPLSSSLLRGNNQMNNGIMPNINDEISNKMNLSHIKITSNNHSSMSNYSQFINKNNISILPSPELTNVTNKININHQNNSNYKKGMFSYPKSNNNPVVVQNYDPQEKLNEKPSFLNILNRPEKQITSTNKEETMSQRSGSTSKFDLNKFKITKNNESKSVENVLINRTKYEPNTNKQSLVSGNVSPSIQTIDNTGMTNYNNSNVNGKMSSYLIADNSSSTRKNNFSKYLINEGSNKDLTNNNTYPNNIVINDHFNNQIVNSLAAENTYYKVPTEQIQIKTQNSLLNSSLIKDKLLVINQDNVNKNKVERSGTIVKRLITEDSVNNPKEKEEVGLKTQIDDQINNEFLEHDLESRRMTLELIKIILKTTPSLNNNAINAFKQINVDSLLIKIPSKANKKSNDEFAKLRNIKQKRLSDVQQISNSLEIKNNNFEINNYYGNYSEENKKVTSLISSKFINKPDFTQEIPFSTYNLNENSEEKLKWLTNLITPRVMTMNYDNVSVPFIFKLVPTNLCFIYGLEHYVLEFQHLTDKNEKGSIDLLKINHCTLKGDSSFIIALDNDKKELEFYEIIATDKGIASMYVQAINFMSQLIKCKIYAKTQIK